MITIKANLLNVGECIALWEVIGMAFPKDVSHATARQDLKTAATHPHSERQLYNIRKRKKKIMEMIYARMKRYCYKCFEIGKTMPKSDKKAIQVSLKIKLFVLGSHAYVSKKR